MRFWQGGSRVILLLTLSALLVAPSAAGAENRWFAPGTLSNTSEDSFNPQVAVNSQGRAVAIWTSNGVIYASFRPPGGRFGAREQVSGTGQGAFEPQVALDPNGKAFAVWTAFPPANPPRTHIQAASKPLGGSWSTVQTISNTSQDASSPRVSADPQGNAIAVWAESPDLIKAAASQGGTFGSAETISDPGQKGYEPDLAAEPNGEGVAVWTRFNTGEPQRIKYARKLNYTPPQSLTGGTPLRVPLVPAFNECTSPTPGQLHGGGLPDKAGCSNPQLGSSTVTLGTSNTPGTRVANARIDVCSNTAAAGCTQLTPSQVPDVRLRGNSSDVVCKAGAPLAACPGGAGSDYDPNPAAGPYLSKLDPGTDSNAQYPSTSATLAGIPCHPSPPNPSACGAGADMTAVAKIPTSSSSGTIRVTDEYGTDGPITVSDQVFPVPVVCKANGTGNGIGSYCGVNTTANALAPGAVVGGKAATVEIGQLQVFDSGVDGIRNNADDRRFATQGLFIP